MSDNTTDFFDNIGGGAGAPTALLKGVGDFVHGEVVEMFKRDYVPFGQKDPEKDEKEADGKRKQLVVILQTTLSNWQGVVKVPVEDPSTPDSPAKAPSEDDGKRAIYIPNRSNVQYAVGRAVQAAQAPFEVGGTLGVKIANLKDTGKGNPLKEHEAVYKAKPAPTGEEFFNSPAPSNSAPTTQAPPPAPTPAPQAQAPAPAAPAASAPTQVDPWSGAPATSEPPF